MPETPPAPQFWQSKMSWDSAKCFFGGGKITPIENYCFKIRFYNSPKESLMACFSSFFWFFLSFPFFLSKHEGNYELCFLACCWWVQNTKLSGQANPAWRLLQSWRHTLVLYMCGLSWSPWVDIQFRICSLNPENVSFNLRLRKPLDSGRRHQRPSLWQAGRGLFGLLICFHSLVCFPSCPLSTLDLAYE